MRSSNLEIASPCHESWEAMEGAGARRFCGACQKDVHDLSAMAQAEAEALLRAQGGASLCVRYTAEIDGTLRFRDLVPRASLTRKIARAAFAASMLAACTPHGAGPVIHDLGATILESIRAQTVPTADGGCDYPTGPFTTFHLPAGHAFCHDTGEARPEPPTIALGTIGAGEEEPPPDPEPAPVVDEIPWVDPDAAPPRMGQAIARPERVDPRVPCDPQPAVAPPVAEPEPRSYPIKGRLKIRPQPKHKTGAMVVPDEG